MRKTIQSLLKDPKQATIVITTERIFKNGLAILNLKKHHSILHKERIGIATGLAWTEVGGDVLRN